MIGVQEYLRDMPVPAERPQPVLVDDHVLEQIFQQKDRRKDLTLMAKAFTAWKTEAKCKGKAKCARIDKGNGSL